MAEDLLAVGAARIGFAVLLAVACLTDLRSRRIPNLISIATLVSALMWHGFAPSGAGLFDPYMAGGLGFRNAAVGAGFSLVVLLVPYSVGVLGAGDVKLLTAVGAWMGTAALPVVWLAVMVSGAVLALAWAFVWGDLVGTMRRTVGVLKALMYRSMGMPGMALLGGEAEAAAVNERRLPFALAITGGCVSYGIAVNTALLG